MSYFLLGFYGFYLNVLGPITPFLKDELNLSYTVSSLHFTAFAAGILVVGFAGHLLIVRAGRWVSLWLGAFGLSIGAVVLVIGRSPAVTVTASLFMGLVGSLILVIVPAVLSDRHADLRPVALTEANVIASLIVTAAPLLVGIAARSFAGWRLAILVVAVAPVILRLGFRAVRPSLSMSGTDSPRSGRRKLPLLYWVFWLALTLSISVEFCMVFWSADYLETSLGMARANAAQAVSLFLAGMIVGRVAGSRVVHKVSARIFVTVSVLIAAAGFVSFWFVQVVTPALAGLFICGLGVANLYPLILSVAIGTAGDNTVHASTRATLASGTAVLALPLLLGRLADLVGIRSAFAVVAFLLVAVLAIFLATGKDRGRGNRGG